MISDHSNHTWNFFWKAILILSKQKTGLGIFGFTRCYFWALMFLMLKLIFDLKILKFSTLIFLTLFPRPVKFRFTQKERKIFHLFVDKFVDFFRRYIWSCAKKSIFGTIFIILSIKNCINVGKYFIE